MREATAAAVFFVLPRDAESASGYGSSMSQLRRRFLEAIGRPHPSMKLPSADEPRAGYMSYTMRLLLGDGGRRSANRRASADSREKAPNADGDAARGSSGGA
jgi:hypothetical protein